MHQKAILDNGLRIVTSAMAHARSICTSIYIGAGSRYELPQQAGISHFIEHLCFKGTERRPTTKEICEDIEGVGGIFNGGTCKEFTTYWAKVARPHFPIALDVLADMLLHSKFDPMEIEKERKVITEEIKRSMDSPQDLVDILIDEVLWPDQALGRDVAGSKETIRTISRQMISDYMPRQYLPNNTVVSVAGDVSHDEVVASFAKVFADWPQGVCGTWFPVVNNQHAPRLRVESKKTEQAHLCLAVPGLSSMNPDRYISDIINVILGEGMSSRLFLEIRERRGLAYDIHSYSSHLLDSGSVTIYAGVDPKKVKDTIVAILKELSQLKEEKVPESELVKAKELAKGRLMLSMEDTRSVSGWMGAQELLTGNIRSVDEVVSIVDAINPEDVQRVAQGLFLTNGLTLALVGPIRNPNRLESLLNI
ncbi:M16 family metallopeptidase [Chloroflexota bacterium]